MIADDLFAGAGGWDLAAAKLGIHARGVENMKEAPADYPWAGSRSKQFEQCGNAVPPGLAIHALAAAAGLDAEERAA